MILGRGGGTEVKEGKSPLSQGSYETLKVQLSLV